jgi:hypothetical protein
MPKKDLLEPICGYDGHISLRRILSLSTFSVWLYICIYSTIKCKDVSDTVIWSLVAVILTLLGYTTFDKFLNVKIGKNGNSTEESNFN